MLTEFFKICSTDKKVGEKKLLYREFPEHYIWEKQGKFWKERKQRDVMGRINGTNPAEGERYYLRLLLNHVRCPKSFENLLTVDGYQYPSFKEATQKRGLLESDQSINECLEEAVTFQMPEALRRLFATILVFCEPTDVGTLWSLYLDAMSEDFASPVEDSIQFKGQKTLSKINFYLESMGKKISDYDLPTLLPNITENSLTFLREIIDEMNVVFPDEDIEAKSNLNSEQLIAYSVILARVNSNTSGVFFINGPGRTGKTYLYHAMLAQMRSKGLIALATATSGVAAAIMPGRRTAHSRFKIPIPSIETSLCNKSKQSGIAKLIEKARLIIWDEAPMAKRFAIETLDRSLKDIMNSQDNFGGKVIVFGGDFRQVLPVVPRGTRIETVNASLVKSYLWCKMEKFTLTTNMRARTDPAFSNFLLRVGNGDEPTTKMT